MKILALIQTIFFGVVLTIAATVPNAPSNLSFAANTPTIFPIQTTAFSSVTGGYSAFVADCDLLVYTVNADAGSPTGESVSKPVGTAWNSGQIRCGFTGVTPGTYYLKIMRRTHSLVPGGEAANSRVWWNVTPFPLYFDNSRASKTGSSEQFAWTTLGTGYNFSTGMNTTDEGTLTIGGADEALYISTEHGVELVAVYLSTDQNATPIFPTGGGGGQEVSYEVLKAASAPSGVADTDWALANSVSLTGFNSGVTGSPVIKALWISGTPDRVCFYYQLTAANLEFATTTDDDTTVATETALRFTGRFVDTQQLKDADLWRLIVNGNATPALMDATWPAGAFSTTADVTNATEDRSYTAGVLKVQLCFDAPEDITDDKIIWGDFTATEKVTGSGFVYKRAFGTTDNDGDQTTFALMRFSATEITGSADTDPPGWTGEDFVSVANTSMVCQGTPDEAVSATCLVDTGATFVAAELTFGPVNCSAGVLCQITATGLTAGTQYAAILRGVDGAGNSGDSSSFTDTTTSLSGFFVRNNGSGSTCSSGAPCAMSALTATSEPRPSPGETWFIMDHSTGGQYGVLSLDCSAGQANGTASQPIIISAQNERAAYLKQAGSSLGTLQVRNCSWWRFEGLRLESVDNAGETGVNGGVVYVNNSSNLVFRRNIFAFTNRFANVHELLFINSHNNLIEENEFYSWHRHAMVFSQGNSNIIRRNYANNRGYAASGTCPGFGCAKLGFSVYPGSNNIFENNIVEDAEFGELNAAGTAVNNRYLGNIAYNAGAFIPNARGNSLTQMPRDTLLVNNLWVASDGSPYGCMICAFDSKNTQVKQNSFISLTNRGVSASKLPASLNQSGDGAPSTFIENSLFLSVSGAPWSLSDQSSLSVNFARVFSSGSPSPGLTDGNVTNESTTDPSMGSCRAFIPDASNLKGAGLGGADIGANILYAYEGGVLNTSKKLWNTSTNQINATFRGATVNSGGLNTTTNSIHDFGTRLHPSCASWPAGY